MSGTGLASFDTTLQETNLWLKGIEARLRDHDRHLAYVALRATLHALRDRIGAENAVHLGAQLPMLLRGLYYEGWRMAAPASRERHKAEFLAHVARELPEAVDPERAARAVFFVMWQKIDAGEVGKLLRILPAELRDLWAEGDAAA
ncbi:MAG: DUF2267 domain-containing protein [Dongiaceae bacterium]